MTDPTPTPTPDPPAPTPPAPKPNWVMIGIALLASVGLGLWAGPLIFHRDPPPPPPVTFTPTPKDLEQQRLEELTEQIAAQMFGEAVRSYTPEVIARLEKLARPYPNATLDLKASKYEPGGDSEGTEYRLIYDTPDTPEQVRAWYEQDISADYRRLTESKSGLKATMIAVRVPGVATERDITIVSIPDELTGTSATQIWVTVRDPHATTGHE